METHDPMTLRLVPAWDQLLILHFPGHYERGGVRGALGTSSSFSHYMRSTDLMVLVYNSNIEILKFVPHHHFLKQS